MATVTDSALVGSSSQFRLYHRGSAQDQLGHRRNRRRCCVGTTSHHAHCPHAQARHLAKDACVSIDQKESLACEHRRHALECAGDGEPGQIRTGTRGSLSFRPGVLSGTRRLK
jgi:hypothetical protein